MKRRDFLLALAGLTAARPSAWTMPSNGAAARDALGALLPTRPLGAGGEPVTMLGLGGYHVGWTAEALAQAVIETALDEGIRFFDTAENYGRGASEERYGRFLVPKYREQVFIMTKTQAADAASAREHLDRSRSRLGVDVIDLWQLHALATPEDVDSRIAAGVVDVLVEAKAAGRVRHIGFTGHASPYAHLRILERYAEGNPFTACQMPINPVDAAAPHSFAEQALPAAARAGLGVLAMKTLADGRFFAKKVVNERVTWQANDPVVPDRLSIAHCCAFAWSLPIAVLITGAEKPEFVRDKAAICRRFATLDEAARAKLISRVAEFAQQGRVEYYKAAELRNPTDPTERTDQSD
jgi:aryl-alcohol dehydrogenase-like predicted oxidoreductase